MLWFVLAYLRGTHVYSFYGPLYLTRRRQPMYRTILLATLFFAWLASGPALAQEFDLVDTNPASGDAAVSLSETILFEYNQSLSVNTTDWNTAFVEPRGKLSTSRTQLCIGPDPCGEAADDPAQQRFVRYVVDHEPDTDYTWIVYTTRNTQGETMATPKVLRYTTASSIGQRIVSGSVGSLALPALQASMVNDTPEETQELLWATLNRLQEEGLGQTIIPATPIRGRDIQTGPNARDQIAPAAQNNDDGHTIIYMLESFDVREPEWQVLGADVITGQSGSYSAEFMRDGEYWPLAVRYTDRERLTIEGIGFYDENGDRLPDPVSVEGSSRSGIDLLMFDFPLTTAKTNAGLARSFATKEVAYPELKRIEESQNAQLSGKAYEWKYSYYSDEDDELVQVTVGPFGVQTDTFGSSSSFAQREEIPREFVDSDEALEITLDDGGQDFIDDRAFRPRNLTISIRGEEAVDVPNSPSGTNWRVRITGRTTSGTTTFERYVDMGTGAIVGDPALAAGSSVLPSRTLTHYPNPAADEVTFDFSLEEEAEVVLQVFDVAGREVATVLNGERMTAGSHTISWEPQRLASGVYIYRLSTGGDSVTRRLVLRR